MPALLRHPGVMTVVGNIARGSLDSGNPSTLETEAARQTLGADFRRPMG